MCTLHVRKAATLVCSCVVTLATKASYFARIICRRKSRRFSTARGQHTEFQGRTYWDMNKCVMIGCVKIGCVKIGCVKIVCV